MKGDSAFRYRVMQSTYFNPNGDETLMDVLHAFGDPFKPSSMYAHMQRHQIDDVIKAKEAFNKAMALQDALPPVSVANPVKVIEEQNKEEHEMALDEFIREGRDKLAEGKLTITASSFLTAVNIKANIKKSDKDRKADMIKAFMGKASGNGGTPTET